MFKKEYRIIKKSKLFDENYYLRHNEDVRTSGLDPIKHYIKNGWKEGLNPSERFDTNFYLETYPDVKNAGVNPLVHFIQFGSKERRNTHSENSIVVEHKISKIKKLITIVKHAKNNPQLIKRAIQEVKLHGIRKTIIKIKNNSNIVVKSFVAQSEIINFEELLNLFNKNIVIQKFKIQKPIDIIIPVYNGFQFLEPLIKSIIKNTSMHYRILICDDKSSDEKVLPLLKHFQEQNPLVDIILLENEQNLGFIKTVNKLVAYTNNHFVLLNTDTEVPPYWLERLMYPIFEMKNIASTTPFTNAGTIFSFPNYLEDNPIFENMTVEELDSYFQYVDFEKTYIEVPTGVGFCMGINKALVDKIGMFDEIFGKGYGEENDWCQRAIQNGYKNLHVTNLFVYHKHGGSFPSEEKQRLLKRNSALLSKKFPNYNSDVAHLISQNYLNDLREMLILKILSSKYNLKLFITHALGGGADEYINSYLNDDIVVLKFSYNFLSSYEIEVLYKDRNNYKFSITDYNFIANLLEQFNLKHIYINNLVSYPKVMDMVNYLISIKTSDTKYTYLLHDFYFICPMYNLLDYKIKFCDIPDDMNYCNKCLKINPLIKKQVGYIATDYPNLTINLWRNAFGKLLNIVDSIECFSDDSKKLLFKAYNNIECKDIKVKPHIVDWIKPIDQKLDTKKKVLDIAIIGTITTHKGYSIISSIATFIDSNLLDIKIHIFGQIIEPFESLSFCKCIINHGKYNKYQLTNLIENNNIDMVFIPSIWPETFSYTTQEAINMGIAVACFDFGAPAERLKKYGKSLILSKFEPQYILNKIYKYFDRDLEKFMIKCSKKEDITFVCVSNNDLIYKSTVLSSYYITQYPIIKYDNIKNNLPVPVRYNNAIAEFIDANYDGWIFFIHNDFSILEDINNIVNDLDKNSIYGSIGAILENGKKKLYGEILQGHEDKLIKHGIKIDKPTKVDTVDCQCIFFHSDLIKKYNLRFDENIILDFHQYTEEFCLNAKNIHNINTYVTPFLCKHTSWGTLNAGYYKAEKYLVSKFGKEWAGTCTHLGV